MRLVSHLVVTDLDGTLLDHRDYDYSDALPLLERLASAQIPVIFCSSKTRAEMCELQREMELSSPMISENGGGIFFPSKGWKRERIVLGTPFEQLVRSLRRLEQRCRFRATSFADLSVAQIAELTGLGEKRAALAKKRDFSLPFLLEEETPDLTVRLEEASVREGLRLTRGGRFFHLTGDNDKGRAVRRLLQAYRERFGVTPATLGLGDSRNDLEMLEVVDSPGRIPNPGSGAPLGQELPWRYQAEHPAPRGWAESVSTWLDELGLP